MSVNSNYQWYNCLNGCTRHPIRFRFELELRLPLWQKDAPSSKCSYSWHTLNLVWFLALPGSERDRMGDSQADRQSDSQTSWKPARQTWVSLQKELATWRGANWSQPRGKSSGKRILWKSTIGRQLSAAAAQEEEAIAETGETTLLKQRKQWP